MMGVGSGNYFENDNLSQPTAVLQYCAGKGIVGDAWRMPGGKTAGTLFIA
jgi:hypothetical protein